MAQRPRYKIKIFGFLIEYVGRPGFIFRVDLPNERKLQFLARWYLILALLPRLHDVTLEALSLPLIGGIVGWIVGLFLLMKAVLNLERRKSLGVE